MSEGAAVTSDRAPASSSRIVRGYGGNPPGQGPFLILELEVEGDRIIASRFETYLCPACHECGSAICDLVRGRSISDVEGLNWGDLASRVTITGGQKRICIGLALLALADAVAKFKEMTS